MKLIVKHFGNDVGISRVLDDRGAGHRRSLRHQYFSFASTSGAVVMLYRTDTQNKNIKSHVTDTLRHVESSHDPGV